MMSELQATIYEEAWGFAQRAQKKAVDSLSPKLITKEDGFLERMSRAKASPLKRLVMLYELMDQLSAAMAKHLPCKKGCSACCHYRVRISDIEVTYIEKQTKHRRNKALKPDGQFHGTPCPFLESGLCSIYQARPFVCRRHHALTPNSFWCHPERSDRAFPLIGFTNVDRAYDLIRLDTNPEKPHDIRQHFGEELP